MSLDELKIAQTLHLFGCGELSAAELCQAFLNRIDEIDRSGATLRSVLEVNPDALA